MSADTLKVRLDAILLEATDPEALALFYRQAFDLPEPVYFGPDHLGIDLENTYLGFDRVPGSESESRSRVQFWFQAEDVGARFQRLLSLGARVKYPPESESSPGEVLAMVYDPAGNQVGLIGKVDPDGKK